MILFMNGPLNHWFTRFVQNEELEIKRCSVLLGEEQFCFVFIFSLSKLSKTDNIVSKITLTTDLLNCCIKEVSHLHLCYSGQKNSTRVILRLLLV